MALINCPECNKEISDKADVCPSCGYPISSKESNKIESMSENVKCTENKHVDKQKSKKPLFFIICGVVILAVITLIIFVVIPKNNYNKALDALNSGEYVLAYDSFSKLGNYKDSEKLFENAKYETYVFSCIEEFNNYLKNPDSLAIKEVYFYQGISQEVDNEFREILSTMDEQSKEKPYIVIKYTAQNGFGGNNIGYGMFLYDADNSKYLWYGSCDTLDENEVDEDDEKTCQTINIISDNFESVGNVDINRISILLKENQYSNIKIIE